VGSFRQNLFLLGSPVGLLAKSERRACGILKDGAFHIVSTDIRAGSGLKVHPLKEGLLHNLCGLSEQKQNLESRAKKMRAG
jgi:hypothetical protein